MNGDADVVVYAALIKSDNQAELHRDVIDLLAAGKNVVCTGIEFYPPAFGEQHRKELAEAAEAGSSTLYASSLHPGFLFDRLGVMVTGLCVRLDRISFAEIFDCSGHPSTEMVFGQMGMGSPADGFAADSERGGSTARCSGKTSRSPPPSLGSTSTRSLPPSISALPPGT